MKDAFPQFYRPTAEEFSDLWGRCLFVLDASVLLNVYGYSEATREDLLGLIEQLSDRIRMPYQFGQEYQRNRVKAIMEQVRNYQSAEKILDDLYRVELASKSKHPFLSDKALTAFTEIQKELEENRKKHEALLTTDPYFERISNSVKVVGPPPKNLDKLHDECKSRYASEVPPGYADVKEKGEPAAYGDFIGWSQIMDFAKAEKAPVILVTDDAKEDWWQMHSGRYIGPRPELVAEFLSNSGQRFYMYNSWRFMEMSKRFLKQDIGDHAILEIKERLEQSRIAIDAKPSVPSASSTLTVEKPDAAGGLASSELKASGPISAPVAGSLKEDGK